MCRGVGFGFEFFKLLSVLSSSFFDVLLAWGNVNGWFGSWHLCFLLACSNLMVKLVYIYKGILGSVH